MTVFLALFIKLIPLYVIILLGFVAGRLYKIQKESIAQLLIYFILPVVIFTGAVSTKISLATVSIPILVFFVCCFISVSVFYISGFFWKDQTRNILSFITGSANTGYLGLPVAIAIFGDSVIGIVAAAILGTTLYTNGIGFFIAAKGRHTASESLIKILKMPVLYAFLLGLLVNVLGIFLGKIYFDTAGYFNGAYIILGMMLIGLGLSDIKEYKFDLKFIGISFFAEFILWPAVVLAILFVDSLTFKIYDASLYKIIMLLSVLPVATNVIPYTTILKAQPEKVALVVFLSTFFALFYIPFITTVFF